MSRYDYIVAGAGAAGLSLIVHMILSGAFGDKKILLIDRSPKIENDRTWCFWEEEPGLFESVVYRKWNSMWFHGAEGKSKLHSISPYEYKMIKGIDFYRYSFGIIEQQKNISVQFGDIENIYADENETYLIVNGKRIDAEFIFSSIPGDIQKHKKNYFLWQHFKGWFIQTEKEVFNPGEATLMDFRINQESDTRFVYVMPFSKREALVEFTVFSQNLLDDNKYNDALHDYCFRFLNLKANEFLELSEEFGKIPMSNHQFPSSRHNIIYIGGAGGQTKPSSGYTFRFIQKHSSQIVNELMKNGSPHIKNAGKKFNFYDSVFLRILTEKKLPGAIIFTQLFGHNEMRDVFKFLDNETSIVEDIKLIGTLPKNKFINAALNHLFQ